jgi:hypothetical protein
MGVSRSELVARARERAEASPVPDGWGYRVVVDEGEDFSGRWRGETTDPDNVDDEGEPRRVFLLWDEEGGLCFSRFYAALGREIDRAAPAIGDRIVIARAKDYRSARGTGYSFGVVTEPCDEPLPGADDEEFPF